MHVHDIGPVDGRSECLMHLPCGEDRTKAQRPADEAVLAPGDPGRRARKPGRLASPRRMRHVLDRVAGFGRPQPELPRKQSIGRLIRWQVRRDVNDVQVSLESRNSSCRSASRPRSGSVIRQIRVPSSSGIRVIGQIRVPSRSMRDHAQ